MSKQENKELVSTYICSLPEESQAVVTHLRSFVLSISNEIAEHIKWNSLSFFYNGEMKDFDAKEYKRDILVCNLHRGKILLVFPTGSKVKDDLNGKDYPDGRKIITLNNIDELITHQSKIVAIITHWLSLVEK